MNIHLNSIKPLTNPKFLLLGIATGLIAIHLTVTWRRGYTDLWGISLVFWVTVCYLIWKKRNNLNLASGSISSFLGTLIIAFVLLESIFYINKFPYISPFVSAIGLGLIASGFKGLKQYWQEIVLLFFPSAAYATLLFLVDLPTLTATFAHFVLWYLGFSASRHGVKITLSTGVVEVNPSCSGLESIFQLWVIAILFLAVFPTDWKQRILLPVVASLLGFVMNLVRVVLMTILIAFNNYKAFEYWHTGDGSLLISMIYIIVFVVFCLYLVRLKEGNKKQGSINY